MRLCMAAVTLAISAISTPSLAFDIIIRTFIPKEHPSKPGYIIPVPGQPEKTMLPDAPVGQCFGTDNRSFSTNVAESSRFGGKFTINPSALSVNLEEITGTTIEYNCSSGAVVCSTRAGSGGFELESQNVSGDTLTIHYSGEASNPCLLVAPDIEFSGKLTINRTAKTISLEGKVDCFPSFEAILVRSNGTAEYLYRSDPESGATPACLVTTPGGGSRQVTSQSVAY